MMPRLCSTVLAGSLVVVGLVRPPLAFAQSAVGYQQLSITTTPVVSLPAGVRGGATVCRGTLEAAPIRITFDGSTPTTTAGQPVAIGDEVVLQNIGDINNFRAIATGTGLTGLLNMTCSSGTPPLASYIRPAATANLAPLAPQGTNAVYAVQQSANDSRACQTANVTAAVNTTVTLTLTPPNGQFVYLCGLDITVSQDAVGTTPITNLTFTSTNLGGWLWKFSQPAVVQDVKQLSVRLAPGLAIKAAQAGTAVTIVSPAVIATAAYSVTGYYRYAP